jgi:hypothetical protein
MPRSDLLVRRDRRPGESNLESFALTPEAQQHLEEREKFYGDRGAHGRKVWARMEASAHGVLSRCEESEFDSWMGDAAGVPHEAGAEVKGVSSSCRTAITAAGGE